MGNVRLEAINIIDKVLNKGAYSNLALDSAIKKAGLSSLDNSLLTELVYGTLKYKYTIDIILKKYLKNMENTNKDILNILRISVYQLKYLDRIPDFAVLNEAVNISKKVSLKHSKLVNAVLRSYLRDNSSIEFKDSILNLSYKYSFLPWMTKLFIKQQGKENARLIMEGLNKTPGINVRVNRLKTTFQEACGKLLDNGYNIKEGIVSPYSINIINGKSIESNPLFKDGYITVQDESAMLPAEILDLNKGMTVIDMCSAPGGKTTEIAEIMENSGKVYAFDLYQHKLKLINKNLNRLGIKNTETDNWDATLINDNFINKADRILLDVPCSGLGIIRKKPEIKWNKSPDEFKSLVNVQRKILSCGSKYLKPGGILVYSTCTLNKNENEDNINWFLEKNDNYTAVKIEVPPSSNFHLSKEGFLTIFPDEYMDGFFMAKLKKIK